MSQAIEEAAELLRKAYQSGAVPPLRGYLDPTDADGAYAVQEINTKVWTGAGRRIVGRKVGLTAEAVQRQLGVAQPDFGVLFADMQIANGGTLRADLVLQPKAEAEIAFVLARDLPARAVTSADVIAAVDYVVPAIEIVDSRIGDWKITFADTVADNGSSAFFVLGESRHDIRDVDLYSCGMVMELNGSVASLGAGAACLGSPVNAATWLANVLAERGTALRAGEIILTGALGPMVALQPGDAVRAVVGGLGVVEFDYEGPGA